MARSRFAQTDRRALGVVTRGALLVAVSAYAWWVTGLRSFTWPIRLAVGLPALALLGEAARRDRNMVPLSHWVDELRRCWRSTRTPGDPGPRRRAHTYALWGVLILSLALLQLFAYFAGFGGRRSDYPTLSWLIGHIEWRAPRLVMFVGWLALGVYLGRR
jgi:hypothetical protein